MHAEGPDLDNGTHEGGRHGSKALLHLVPRSVEAQQFEDRVRETAARLRTQCGDVESQVHVMFRVGDDPLGRRTQFAGSIEVTGGVATTTFLESLAPHAGDMLDQVAHLDLSSFLVGDDVGFIVPKERAPIRYQYLMRRQAKLSHAQYIKYYQKTHSQFGIQTPGIEGYAQFLVDVDTSRRAARAGGFGVWAVDSVSQLSLVSVKTFIAAVSTSKVGPAATADERTFVDRRNSHDFNSRVEWDDA